MEEMPIRDEKKEIENTIGELYKKSFNHLDSIHSAAFISLAIVGTVLLFTGLGFLGEYPLIYVSGLALYTPAALLFLGNEEATKKALAKYPKMCRYAKRLAKNDESVREMLEKVKEWDDIYNIDTSYNESNDSIHVVDLGKKEKSLLVKASLPVTQREVNLKRALVESSMHIEPMKQPDREGSVKRKIK